MSAEILVLGFNRPQFLNAVLESLRRQDSLHRTHVWLDGTGGLGNSGSLVRGCRISAEKFRPASITALAGNAGINKMMLDALWTHTARHDACIVLEDDCFPSRHAIAELDAALDSVRNRTDIFSVYGHHFGVPGEDRPFPRFQGWGWAAWSNRLRPIVELARQLFLLPEPEFLKWVKTNLTPDVRRRMDVTRGRNAIAVIERSYSWDALFAMLSAMQGMMHMPTRKRVIYNCGLDSGHFSADPHFLEPPFNMVHFDQIWDHFDEPLC